MLKSRYGFPFRNEKNLKWWYFFVFLQYISPKTMKLSINSLPILGLALLLSGSFSSCTTEGCTDERSDNYDSTVDQDNGSCQPIETVRKFLATYIVTESCADGAITQSYVQFVEGDKFQYEFKINHYVDPAGTLGVLTLGEGKLVAEVSKYTFTIPAQQMDTLSSIWYTGQGFISADRLELQYKMIDSAESNPVDMVKRDCELLGLRIKQE